MQNKIIIFFCLISLLLLSSCRSKTTIGGPTTNTHFNGIDISHHQGKIDWKQVAKEERVSFVYIKATEGGTYQDPLYKHNLKQARKRGLKVGSYHFLRTTSSIWLQYLNIMCHIKKEKQDLVPMIDVEECKHWTSEQLQDSLKLLVRLIENEYGQKPIIYAGQNFYTKRLGNKFADYPLWIARYGDVPPALNAPYSIWQFTQKGKLTGIKGYVDLNRFAPNCEKDILLK